MTLASRTWGAGLPFTISQRIITTPKEEEKSNLISFFFYSQQHYRRSCTGSPKFQNSVFPKKVVIRVADSVPNQFNGSSIAILSSDPDPSLTHLKYCTVYNVHHSFPNTVLEDATFGWLNDIALFQPKMLQGQASYITDFLKESKNLIELKPFIV